MRPSFVRPLVLVASVFVCVGASSTAVASCPTAPAPTPLNPLLDAAETATFSPWEAGEPVSAQLSVGKTVWTMESDCDAELGACDFTLEQGDERWTVVKAGSVFGAGVASVQIADLGDGWAAFRLIYPTEPEPALGYVDREVVGVVRVGRDGSLVSIAAGEMPEASTRPRCEASASLADVTCDGLRDLVVERQCNLREACFGWTPGEPQPGDLDVCDENVASRTVAEANATGYGTPRDLPTEDQTGLPRIAPSTE